MVDVEAIVDKSTFFLKKSLLVKHLASRLYRTILITMDRINRVDRIDFLFSS